jgi:hypothetical protein
MIGLIRHLISNNLDEIVSKSILDCHCRGVHSIMLLDAPEKRIRMYISVEGSDMYKNMYQNFSTDFKSPKYTPRQDMSVGFHTHHCNLTLECVMGEFHNWIVKEISLDEKGFDTQKWEYQSYITKGEMGFNKISDARLDTVDYKIVKKGEVISLNSKEIHTVACQPFGTTAWLVYEGKEDPDYKSYIWSTNDLNSIDSTKLYTKPHELMVIFLLKHCNLL